MDTSRNLPHAGAQNHPLPRASSRVSCLILGQSSPGWCFSLRFYDVEQCPQPVPTPPSVAPVLDTRHR